MTFLFDENYLPFYITRTLAEKRKTGCRMSWSKSALGATVLLASAPGSAQTEQVQERAASPEIGFGIFAHGVRRPWTAALPPGVIYEGEEERGTADVQFVYRSAPLTKALKPRLTARLQINTDGRTDFASVGAEWRQHVFSNRLYGQIGIGLTIQDGYRYTPDPFASGISVAEAERRYDIYRNRTAFGSRVLFNPNLSIGVRVNRRWAVEAAFEHFSHRRLFSEQNPGIDTVGLRLIRTLGHR
ncbi:MULTISPECIES: acyloxyacyl hydrolase [unclassified Sphingomonas]|uniref:acyloxyacyl hydrolase n=1 Tax=unclassified Sphingomonas TaxID=196159 RepID=UPI00226A8DC3|nr:MULTISPECIES: acyloxyacyl hydrolase [unclassified Sphingomonas]